MPFPLRKKSPTFTVTSLFVGATLNGPLFMHYVHFYKKYLVLDFERIQSLLYEIQNYFKTEGSPFQFFGTLRFNPFSASQKFFNVSKASSFNFF